MKEKKLLKNTVGAGFHACPIGKIEKYENRNVGAGFHACPLEKAKKYENRNVGAGFHACPIGKIEKYENRNVGAGFHACPIGKIEKYENRNVGADVSVCPNEKGITLIALVITIIVLLILAGVTISMVVGDNGILTRAKEAKEITAKAEFYEKIRLELAGNQIDNIVDDSNYLELTDVVLDFLVNGEITNWDKQNRKITIKAGYEITAEEVIKNVCDGKWIQLGAVVSNGETVLYVGDEVDYNPGTVTGSVSLTAEEIGIAQTVTIKDEDNITWKVLGAENGRVLLISDVSIGDVELSGQNGYENGIEALNKISEIYGKGEFAEGARSVKAEDINRVTGYNPETAGYQKDQIDGYGNEVTYYWQGTNYPYYKYTKSDGTEVTGSLSSSHTSFNWYENGWKQSPKSTTATTSNREEITTLKNSYYYYYPQSLTTTSTQNSNGISKGSNEYALLFQNFGTSYYWLGSQCVHTYSNRAGFGVRFVFSGNYVFGYSLYGSNGNTITPSYGVRPAVYLSSDVQFSGNSTDGWTLSK